ncbi:glucosaminidase domain-containing protein, partial [Lactobacillus delbrueckii]
ANNPRYDKVLDHAGDAAAFAHGLQRAGYATDPQYGAKLSKIIKHSLA